MSPRRRRAKGRGNLRYWLPVVAYVGLIFTLSSIEGLSAPEGISFSDKLAHAAEYGLLGFLLVRALRGTGTISETPTAALVALIVGLLIGLGDELYQSTVPGRDADPADFAADAVGLVLSGLAFVVLEKSMPGHYR